MAAVGAVSKSTLFSLPRTVFGTERNGLKLFCLLFSDPIIVGLGVVFFC